MHHFQLGAQNKIVTLNHWGLLARPSQDTSRFLQIHPPRCFVRNTNPYIHQEHQQPRTPCRCLSGYRIRYRDAVHCKLNAQAGVTLLLNGAFAYVCSVETVDILKSHLWIEYSLKTPDHC
jgi:hypothetical protein